MGDAVFLTGDSVIEFQPILKVGARFDGVGRV